MDHYTENEITAQVAEVKENLSHYLTEVKEGKTITILKGKKREPVAQLVPMPKPKKRHIMWGALKTEQPIDWSNFEFTEAELDEILNEPIFPDERDDK